MNATVNPSAGHGGDGSEEIERPGERLAKRVAQMKSISRREAEEIIEAGFVKVDGQVIEEPQFKVLEQHIDIDAKVERVMREQSGGHWRPAHIGGAHNENSIRHVRRAVLAHEVFAKGHDHVAPVVGGCDWASGERLHNGWIKRELLGHCGGCLLEAGPHVHNRLEQRAQCVHRMRVGEASGDELVGRCSSNKLASSCICNHNPHRRLVKRRCRRGGCSIGGDGGSYRSSC